MSVYRKRKKDGVREAAYSYDFRWNGHRFSGQTGETERRRAEQVEKRVRDAVRAGEIDRSKPLSFGAAATLWWDEVGRFHRNAVDTERRLAWLQTHIGIATPLIAIDAATVASLVARRRSEKATGRRGRPVSNKTVNLDVIEPLRGILLRAGRVWEAKTCAIDWRALALPVAKVHVREATRDEEAAIAAAMPPDYAEAVAFAFLSGCRLAEIVGLEWRHVDWFNRVFTVTGKGDKSRTIPMTEPIAALLWRQKDHHRTAVFTYVARRTRDGRVKGRRYPITISGLKTAWRRYRPGDIERFRFHDTRHTAASRVARETGDLRIVRDLLGHTDIGTTARYAHLTSDDLRAGLERTHARHAAGGATQTPRTGAAGGDKRLKRKGKR